jgi:UPF0288 family protein (methanogenesis marker protein 3)
MIYSRFERQSCNHLYFELAKNDNSRRSLAHQYAVIRDGLFQVHVNAVLLHCTQSEQLKHSHT